MSVVLNTNEQSTRIRSIYNRNVGQMNAAMTRLATTRKINSAKDGAANWAISEKMRERIRANDQANQNVQNDTALLKVAQDGYSNTLDILQTLKERAINSANDANVSTDRIKIAEEVKQLVAQIDDNAAKVKFNGRQLLNGASEAGAAESASNPVTKDLSNVVAPNAVSANSPRGTHAVYSLTSGLYTWDSTNSEIKAVSDSDYSSVKLVDLVRADAKTGTETYFKADDTVTLTWKENGEDRIQSMKIDSSTTVSGLLSGLQLGTSDALKMSWVAADTALTSSDSTTANQAVKDMQGDALKSGSAGIYVVGNKDLKITDLALAVTYNDHGTLRTRETAQEIFTFNPVQQAYGAEEGSNMVFSTSKTADVTGNHGNGTTLKDLKLGTQYVFDSGSSARLADSAEITFNINGKELKVTADTTIDKLNEAFESEGINVRVALLEKGQAITYDGTAVTRGTSSDSAAIYASHDALYFVGANGEDITSFNVKMSTGRIYAGAFGNASAVVADTTTDLVKLQSLAKEEAASTSTADSGLPQGEALQFFVGGEANFGINFTFGKANVENLFGMTGDKFAKMFETKETAEEALTYIDDAINKTLVEQTRLGALEARLGYTSDNLTSMNTNLESGISAYRDADIAKEMTDYMKYSVLQQSSQYMLAQATQNPFSVLQLLQP